MKAGFCQNVFLIFVCLSNISFARDKHVATTLVDSVHPKTSIDFIENKGQWDCPAIFKADIPGGALFLTPGGLVYNFVEFLDLDRPKMEVEGKTQQERVSQGHAYKVTFVGGHPSPLISTNQKRNYYHNYFLDNNALRWAGKVGLFGQVRYQDIYPGIDLVLYSDSENDLKYDFIVAAGSNPEKIALSFEGVLPELDPEGNLHIPTSVNEVVEQAPFTYQFINNQKIIVKSRYKLTRSVLSFEFPEGYNRAYDLVIDPKLIFATYSGSAGSSYFYAHSSTYDKLGNTYTAALARGPDWPSTIGAYQDPNKGQCVAIAKINARGTALMYATYFGTGLMPNTLRVNDRNELFLAGTAWSIPVTEHAFQKDPKKGTDICVVHFSEDGSSLLGSTYIGGNGNEACLKGSTLPYKELSSVDAVNPVEIAFARNGTVWVTSNTGSEDFPTTSDAVQKSNAGSHDAVIFNMSADCSTLLYSTYFGDTGWDGGIGIELDSFTNTMAVVGWTSSDILPNTSGALKTTNSGGADGFVATFNATSGTNTHTSFLGTASDDFAQRVAFDKEGNIYVAGRSGGGSYPVSPGAYSIAHGTIFIQKLDSSLARGVASTVLCSNSNSVIVSAMMVDTCGNILLATIGDGPQPGWPTTPDAFETKARPFWFCALTPNFSNLYFGSYFGSSYAHYHPGIARIDPDGIIYHSVCVSGSFGGIDFPITPHSFAPKKLNGNRNDNITFKFNFESTGVRADFLLDPALSSRDTGCAPYHVLMENLSSSAVAYVWDWGDGSPVSTEVNPTHTFTLPGTYTITLYAQNDNARCVTSDTAYRIIYVFDPPPLEIEVADTILCKKEQQIDIDVNIANASNHKLISWQPSRGILSATDQAIVTVDPSVSQTFYVTVSDSFSGICRFSMTDTIHIDLLPRELNILTQDTLVCPGSVIPIVAYSTPGYTYRWTPTIGINDSTLLEPEITINKPNIYTLTATHPTCPDTVVSIEIGMHDIPIVNLGPNKTACQGTNVALESVVVPYRNDYRYQWLPATPGLNAATAPNAYFIADTTITYTLQVTTPIGCTASEHITITVYPGDFGAVSNDTGCCVGSEVALWASGGIQYAWTPNDGLSDANAASPVASPQTSTDYTVFITDQHHCIDTKRVSVLIYPAAVMALPDSINLYPGETYHLQPATNCSYFQWFPPSGINSTSVADPIFSPEVRTRYFVKAITEQGCTLEDSVDVLVHCDVITMPNAFTPTSGSYRTFTAAIRGIVVLQYFVIFDRWGNKVFETKDIAEGWDGTYKGKLAPLGVYVYKVRGMSTCGQSYYKEGNVTLLR